MSAIPLVTSSIVIDGKPVLPEQTVYLRHTEEFWNKPYVRKRHHSPETRSVILQGKVIDIEGNQFKAQLTGNNGFEKDGQTFVFNKLCLLCNQNFTDFKELGAWKESPSSNP